MDNYNFIVKTRRETRDLIKSWINDRERLVISRYQDGEANILKKAKGIGLHVGNENSQTVAPLLKKAIAYPDQFVCINRLKPHNIENNDRWVKVQGELVIASNKKSYGSANWHIYDFQTHNLVLPYLFSGKTLVVSGHGEEVEKAFDRIDLDVECYKTRLKEASKEYDKYKKELQKIVKDNSYRNILFSCGPIGKVLITDLIDNCDSNLVDIGSLINIIIDGILYKDQRTIKKWNMSWTIEADIKKCINNFISRIGQL